MHPTRITAVVIFLASFVPWWFESDVIDLILRYRAVLFGRWSEGHFGALLVLTLLLWLVALSFWSRRPLREQFAVFTMVSASIVASVFAVVYVSHGLLEPRYGERVVTITTVRGIELQGTVRHRPPNTVHEFEWTDRPKHARSYPDAPPGYGAVPIRLTSDHNGFRNLRVHAHHDLVLVGDSFAAGSHVSDEDVISEHLATATGLAIYNLGVSGADPDTYLMNFASYLERHSPKQAIFMIYEGNDFKEHVALRNNAPVTVGPLDLSLIPIASATTGETSPPRTQPSLGDRFEQMFASSPVTRGLERLSEEVFERVGSSRPVPGYAKTAGWMPLAVQSDNATRHYSFEPRRLGYLNLTRQQFAASRAWLITRDIFDHIAELAESRGIDYLFVFVPSTPHVVMPLEEHRIPAQQLLDFARHAGEKGTDPGEFKERVFANLGSIEQVFMANCDERGWHCTSLVKALREATAAGHQMYYTYDQHWTPEGHRIAASVLAQWLRGQGSLHEVPHMHAPASKPQSGVSR